MTGRCPMLTGILATDGEITVLRCQFPIEHAGTCRHDTAEFIFTWTLDTRRPPLAVVPTDD